MKLARGVLFVAAAWLLATVPASGDVRLTIGDGKVSLEATGATLREILGEWARVGQTRVFNAELVVGDPLTIRLEAVPEERALEILLRALNGYVAAPRATPLAGASRFDRIMLMPGTARPRSATTAPPPPPSGNDLTQAPPLPEAEEEADDRPVRVVPAPGQRGSVLRNFPPAPRPAPAEQPPPARPTYTPQPIAPAGVPVPGMIVPVPEDTNPPASQPSSGS